MSAAPLPGVGLHHWRGRRRVRRPPALSAHVSPRAAGRDQASPVLYLLNSTPSIPSVQSFQTPPSWWKTTMWSRGRRSCSTRSHVEGLGPVEQGIDVEFGPVAVHRMAHGGERAVLDRHTGAPQEILHALGLLV